ncbi:MAG: hypothetical protein IJZ82_03520 [Lachnospiraceae bacterium]|nr:hypothetical protein [Lachnospiraceae bacterium]
MKTVELMLCKEKAQLERNVQQVKMRLQNAPEGQLRISKKRKGVEYYYKNSDISNQNGRYVRKEERDLVKGIAQRDYDINVLKHAEERIKAIESFLKKYKATSQEEVSKKTNDYRKSLLDNYVMSDEEYIKQWQEVTYQGKAFAEDAPEIITERGERVRSKSEKIIADKMYMLGIPYRYEYPLALIGNVKVYPDFTILRMPEREEVYLEHFGLMDNSDYVDNMIFKMKTYEKNGIYLGVNFFMTYETGREPLNTRMLDAFLKKLFCKE